jgi:hypothetical protein
MTTKKLQTRKKCPKQHRLLRATIYWHALIERSAPSAAAIPVLVDPAGAMARMPDDVRTAHHCADYTSHDRARRASNESARTGANRNAFQRAGRCHDRHGRYGQSDDTSRKHRAHEKSPWLKSVMLKFCSVSANRLSQ